MGKRTRDEVVTTALVRAGLSVQIKTEADKWFQDMLDNWARSHKYVQLLKTGSPTALTGSSAALPSDFGAGMDNLLFGDDRQPLQEFTRHEFIFQRGYEQSQSQPGRPTFYFVNLEAGVFQFNKTPDQSYTFTPHYFKESPTLSAGTEIPWFPDDEVMIEGMILRCYQYANDEREQLQFAKVAQLLGDMKRGLDSSTSVANKVAPAKATFRNRKGHDRRRLFRF